MTRKKFVILLTLIIFIFLGIGIWIFFSFGNSPAGTSKSEEEHPAIPPKDIPGTSNNALEVGLIRAREWQSDAKLSYIESGNIDPVTNLAHNWNMLFISDSLKSKGLSISITDAEIVSEKEVEYQGSGAIFPDNMMTQKIAIDRVKKMPGYENVTILGVEAIYGSTGEVWYWGVKTSKGTVSIEAQ